MAPAPRTPAFAVFVIIVYIAACLLMSIGDCDMNPMTRNVLATPSASVHLRVLACKVRVVTIGAQVCMLGCTQHAAGLQAQASAAPQASRSATPPNTMQMAVVVLSSCVNSCPKFKAVVLLLLILIAWWSLLSGAGYYGAGSGPPIPYMKCLSALPRPRGFDRGCSSHDAAGIACHTKTFPPCRLLAMPHRGVGAS